MKKSPESVVGSDVVWAHFLSNIEKAKIEIGCDDASGNEAWFRGHSSSAYTLLPSLFRFFKQPNSKNWDHIWQTEKDLYWEFSARAREVHQQIDNSWDILFAMQHYGTPTRLLDWTEILGVAVYFATLSGANGTTANKNSKTRPSSVWVLNPYKLNQLTDGKKADLYAPKNLGWDRKKWDYYSYEELLVEPSIDWRWPIAIYPRQVNSRIHAQRGWFTIHGDEFIPLHRLPRATSFLREVLLPSDAIPAACSFLRAAGLDHYALFPDLQNLSLSLKEKYFLGVRP